MALQPRIARAVSRLRGQLRRLQQVGRAEVEEAGAVLPVPRALAQPKKKISVLESRGAYSGAVGS